MFELNDEQRRINELRDKIQQSPTIYAKEIIRLRKANMKLASIVATVTYVRDDIRHQFELHIAYDELLNPDDAYTAIAEQIVDHLTSERGV